MMHGPINVKSPKNISKWQMGFNSTFKGLIVNATMISTNLPRTEVHLHCIQKFNPSFKEKSLHHKYKPVLGK
jgi:hypothetical protein